MSVVCNTGPIIALAKADHLWLLQRLFETVYIPPTVHRELLAKAGIEAERLDSAFSTFIKVMEADDVPPASWRPRKPWTLESEMRSGSVMHCNYRSSSMTVSVDKLPETLALPSQASSAS